MFLRARRATLSDPSRERSEGNIEPAAMIFYCYYVSSAETIFSCRREIHRFHGGVKMKLAMIMLTLSLGSTLAFANNTKKSTTRTPSSVARGQETCAGFGEVSRNK